MIDTNKYEGHSTEYSYEIVSVDDGKEMYATYALLNDAPLLLAEVKRMEEQTWQANADYVELEKEVKRLRGILGDIVAIDEWGGDGKDVGITITYGDGYTFTGWLNRSYDEVTE